MEVVSSEINNFESRSKSIFDSLLSLENNHKAKESEYVNQTEEILIQKDIELEHHIQSDLDSQFKISCIDSYKRQLKNAPNPLAKHQKKTPDHIINPEKWTKYSLEDVDASQMSTSANFNAAMNFLHKTNETYQDLKLSMDEIVFNKPIGANRMETNCDRDPYFQVGKHLLEKLSEEQEEVQEDLDKMDTFETTTDQIHFKKISKSKNLRSSRKSTEEDSESKILNQIESPQNKEKNSDDVDDDDDNAFDEFDNNQDNDNEENEFGDDFEKF